MDLRKPGWVGYREQPKGVVALPPRESLPFLNRVGPVLTPVAREYLQLLAEAVEFHIPPLTEDVAREFYSFGREMYEHRALRQPFGSVMYTISREGSKEPVHLLVEDRDGIWTVILHRTLCIEFTGDDSTVWVNWPVWAFRYAADGTPQWTFVLDDPELSEPGSQRVAFALHTVIVATALLLSRDVHHRIEPAPIKLNKHRARKGKSPIPERHFITIRPGAVHRANGDGHGTHASPRTHWRRGHVRRLATGKITAVAPCIVNGADAALPTYRVKEPA